MSAFESLVLNRWGCPKYLLTDNGTEFVNTFVTNQLKQLGIHQTTVPPYHAQANPVERVNRTIKTMICTFIPQDQRDWDKHLPELCFAINTAVQSSTMMTPAFLNLGRNPRPAKALRDEDPNPQPLDPGDPDLWNDRMKRLPLIHDWVHRNLEQAAKRQARYYNKNRKDARYSVGDLVMRKHRVLSSGVQNFAAKLAPRFNGPYKILKVLSPVVYEIEDPDSRKNPKVHIKDLKPYRPSEEPNPDENAEATEAVVPEPPIPEVTVDVEPENSAPRRAGLRPRKPH